MALAYCPRSRQLPKEMSPSSNSYSTCHETYSLDLRYEPIHLPSPDP